MMLRRATRVAAVVALAAVAGCGGGSSPTVPPATTPTPAPTPTPASCVRQSPTFLDEVDGAINLLGQQHPELFNFNDTAGAGGWRVLDADRYYSGVIANLQAKDYCAGFDLQNLQVKNSNTFSEDYDILLSSGFVRRGAVSYRQTCSPANFPLDPKDLIDSVRVAFFGFRCPDDVAVPNNGGNRLPVGCTGNVTATPKNKNNQDVDPRIHGSQFARPETLVARTIWSRYLRSFGQVPMHCSVLPCVTARGGTGYISAVSMKFTPCSSA